MRDDVRRIRVSELMRRYARLSERARRELRCRLGLQYGPTRAETLDFFPSSAGAPLLVLIHGGFWRLGSARDISLLARGPVAGGIAVAIIDHGLCPAVTIDEITAQMRNALAWLWHEADALGIDRTQMVVAGHSAGAQQAGMLLATDWTTRHGLPARPIKGAIAVSGIFDLRPLLAGSLRRPLRLSLGTVRRQSPLRHLPSSAPPLIVVYGSDESTEFRRQSRAYFAAWRRRGLPGKLIKQHGGDHFTAFESFSRSSGLLNRHVRSLLGGGTACDDGGCVTCG
jgi:arylformamidase